MRVMIQLRADAAMELHQEQGSQSVGSAKTQTQAEQLLKAAAELGVKLEPTAENVISHFNRFEIVEAAYLKPEEQLP